MLDNTEANNENLLFKINVENDNKNKKTCINCEKKIFCLSLNCEENTNLNINQNVKKILQEDKKKFLYMMQEILCLCKQHKNNLNTT